MLYKTGKLYQTSVSFMNIISNCLNLHPQVPGSDNLVVVRQNRVNLSRTLQKRQLQKNMALLPPVGNNSTVMLIDLLCYCYILANNFWEWVMRSYCGCDLFIQNFHWQSNDKVYIYLSQTFSFFKKNIFTYSCALNKTVLPLLLFTETRL